MIVAPPVVPREELYPGFVAPLLCFVDPEIEYRLIQALRDAAQTKDPIAILARTAVELYEAQRAATEDEKQAGVEMGNALADLAASGREAYRILKNSLNMTSLKDATPLRLAAKTDPPTDSDGSHGSSARPRLRSSMGAPRLSCTAGGAASAARVDRSLRRRRQPHRPVNMPAPPTSAPDPVSRFFKHKALLLVPAEMQTPGDLGAV